MWTFFALFFVSCAARKNVGSPGRVVLDRACIRSIDLTEETYCEREAEGKPWNCHQAAITYVKGCEVLKLNPKEKEKSK